MKICDCYKNQLKDILEKNEINIIDFIPKCSHKDKIIDTFKNELFLILMKNNIDVKSLVTKIGGLKK